LALAENGPFRYLPNTLNSSALAEDNRAAYLWEARGIPPFSRLSMSQLQTARATKKIQLARILAVQRRRQRRCCRGATREPRFGWKRKAQERPACRRSLRARCVDDSTHLQARA